MCLTRAERVLRVTFPEGYRGVAMWSRRAGRRTLVAACVSSVLVGAAVAYAAGGFNSYTATEAFCANTPSFGGLSGIDATCGSSAAASAGTSADPVPMAIHEYLTAKGNNGSQAAPLTQIVARVYGEVTDAKDFPVCTPEMIDHAGSTKGWNKVCPSRSLIGTGSMDGALVSGSDGEPAEPPPTCDSYVNIYNGGVHTYHGKPTQEQAFFFSYYPVAPGTQYTCTAPHGGMAMTGDVPAFAGYITPASSTNGELWRIRIPLPTAASTNVAGVNIYLSPRNLNIVYRKLTTVKSGHTVAYTASFACDNGQRPYSFTLDARNYQDDTPPTETTTISHKPVCP